MKIKGRESKVKRIKENNRKDNFYKSNPSGISLIVLVITIIVIIILAAAVILTLNKNNPIEEANRAKYESDVANMQAIFTNTVAKVMAQNQGTIKINAGSLNSIKTVENGVSSVEGRVNYTVNNPLDSSNENGIIIFNTGDSKDTTYYTGRKLPLYSSGETTWYVDSEGVISLKINEQEYGNGDKVNVPAGDLKEEIEIIASDNPMIQIWSDSDTTDFHAEEYKTKITKIKFTIVDKVPKNRIEAWDISRTKDKSVMAWVQNDESNGYELTIAGKEKIIAYPYSNSLFKNFTSVKEIENLEILQEQNNISFEGCSSLKNIDLSKLDMTKVSAIRFNNCSSLENINFGNLVGCKVSSLSFYNCSSLTSLNLNGIDTSNVANMTNMFYNCRKLTSLDLSTFTTSNVTAMSRMFTNCSSLTNLDLNRFDTSKVDTFFRMFYGCNNLENLKFNNFISASNNKTPNCEEMFCDCGKLTTTLVIRSSIGMNNRMFSSAATTSGAKITLNYTAGFSAKVDEIIHNSILYIGNVVKGVQVN